MALPASGQISLGTNVNTELSLTSTAQISLGATGVRNLYGVPTGAIRLAADGYGKSSVWTGTISAPQSNLDLYTWATTVASPAYPGSGAVQVTVAPGVYVYADGATGATVYGMSVPASFPSTVTVVNNGYIMGQGGYGTHWTSATTASGRTCGQSAINIAKPVTITNNSYIAGGGGGSGPAFPNPAAAQFRGGGAGGAGGGRGGDAWAAAPGPGGAGGTIGVSGSPGTRLAPAPGYLGGGGGGRILPGTGGTGMVLGTSAPLVNGGGAGAGGGHMNGISPNTNVVGSMAGGGGWGAAAGISMIGTYGPRCAVNPGMFTTGTGGSAGSVGGNATSTYGSAPPGLIYPGAAGGRAINLNANSVTWGATGTLYGSVA
jgi:hypothetical protein